MKLLAFISLSLVSGLSLAQEDGEAQEETRSWTTTPSRYLGESGNDYIKAMQVRLAMSGRDIGPFGLSQDPNKVKAIPIVKGPRKKVKKVVTPFADVVSSIKISTINFQEKSFLVGIDTYRQGQEFSVEVNSQRMMVRIEEVAKDSIKFTNLKSGETIDRPLHIVPGVILKGKGDIIVPGMTPVGDDAERVMKINLQQPVHSR